MPTYAIGDIQGCYQELLALLDKINFDPADDQLWFTGDLVNRGPESLEVLRFVKQLGDMAIITLGNHDLHLLAVAHHHRNRQPRDTLDTVLAAPDRDGLLDWLRTRPFFHTDPSQGYTLIHAGLPPSWDLRQAADLAHEVEEVLRSDHFTDFLDRMYGDKPDRWADQLTGGDRLRVITNAYTRLRYCDDAGRFALKEKGPPGTQAKPWQPWFAIPARRTKKEKIIFGHWSTVQLGNIKKFSTFNVYPLDTGCVWGATLTALRLEDEKWFSVPSQQSKKFEA